MTVQPLARLDPDGLEVYFTDVEDLRELFKTLAAAPTLPKRLLVIHGVGGVGKSSLLRMFRLHCKRTGVPVALASGDEAKSAVDVLGGWAADLRVEGVKLATFSKTAAHYRAIQAKVEEQVRKANEMRDNAAGALGKAVAKTLVETVVSAIPVIGPFITGLSGMGVEALVDWLGGFLKKPDIDLLLDPTKALTDDFLSDLARVAPKRRLALMLDTFEQMSALEEWARDLAQRLPPNVLLVIAGRATPNWNRSWPGWLAQAEVQELKPMTKSVMQELISRYYATMRGGEPEPAQVETIIGFARGLPIVVTSAVRLWVQYGVEDFQAVKPQVMADLVDRLQEGVPRELGPILEAVAAVRWFNKDILRVISGQTDVDVVYEELRRFPFTRPRAEGLALHTAVREIIDENLRVQDPAHHRTLHELAAAYFEAQLTQTSGEEVERLGLERLYHLVRADEKTGIRLFQETAASLDAYQLLNRLRVLLNDVNSYMLEQENSRLWREYYHTRLVAFTEIQATEAAKIYEAIGANEQAEPKLRAYALCDLGQILVRNVRLSQPGGIEKALKVLEQSQRLAPRIDAKLVTIFWHTRRIYTFRGEMEKAIEFLERQYQFFQQHDDKYGIVYTLGLLRHTYGLMGSWKKAAEMMRIGLELLQMMPESTYLKVKLTGYAAWNLIWSGRYAEASREMSEAITFTREVGDWVSLPYYLHNLGLALGFQKRYQEAADYFSEALKIYNQRDNEGSREKGFVLGFWAATLLKQGELDKAKDYLAQSLAIKDKFRDTAGIPELFNSLGEIEEIKVQQRADETKSATLALAEDYYGQSLGYRWSCRRHFECGALTGLVRVKHVQAAYAAIPALLNEAEQLAQQYEYNDHLASLRLTQGHIAWDGQIPEWDNGFEAALHYYRQALIYALRYNRFLLDEVLWGGGVYTPLRPIIPYCQERGDAGRQMLAALGDWWQTGINEMGTPRPDTISPIPEGISLLEAERLARQREPGDGSPQSTMLKQLEKAFG